MRRTPATKSAGYKGAAPLVGSYRDEGTIPATKSASAKGAAAVGH